MDDFSAQRTIADAYLEEMLQAESSRDYDAWCKRWIKSDLGRITPDIFQKDVEAMHRVFGEYKSREYLGVVRGRVHDPKQDGASSRLRFVWRVVFEKNEALYIVGIRQVEGAWYAYECACSL